MAELGQVLGNGGERSCLSSAGSPSEKNARHIDFIVVDGTGSRPIML